MMIVNSFKQFYFYHLKGYKNVSICPANLFSQNFIFKPLSVYQFAPLGERRCTWFSNHNLIIWNVSNYCIYFQMIPLQCAPCLRNILGRLKLQNSDLCHHLRNFNSKITTLKSLEIDLYFHFISMEHLNFALVKYVSSLKLWKKWGFWHNERRICEERIHWVNNTYLLSTHIRDIVEFRIGNHSLNIIHFPY